MKTQLPTLEELKEFDLESLREFAEDGGLGVQVDDMFDNPPGIVPYKLYAYLSTTFNDSIILDIGTSWGCSALALSFNPTNTVLSYDVKDYGKEVKKENITFKIRDFQKDEDIDYKKVKMILLDTNHTGTQEVEFMQFLIEKDWDGLLLLDDIHLNEPMQNFWECFDEDIKVDVTELGHGVNNSSSPYGTCGTGFVEFGEI